MTGAVALQLCPPSTTGVEHLLDFEFIKAVTCAYAVPTGGVLITGTLVFAAVAMASFIRTGSPIIPLGLLMMTGGAVMATMSGIATAIATVLFLAATAGAFAYMYYRWG